MKKILFAIALIITMGLTSNAQNDGFFNWNNNYDADERLTGIEFSLPNGHGDINDHNAVPLGGGIALLTALGTAYALKKKREK
ncbi:MAG: hypothetical protein IKQ09_00130 [Bacteroidales bacterium]|nr:hypothetical protein [Bacteroidales bacterium]